MNGLTIVEWRSESSSCTRKSADANPVFFVRRSTQAIMRGGYTNTTNHADLPAGRPAEADCGIWGFRCVWARHVTTALVSTLDHDSLGLNLLVSTMSSLYRSRGSLEQTQRRHYGQFSD